MRATVALLALGLAVAVALSSAAAETAARPADRIELENPGGSDEAAAIQDFMQRSLPYKDGQVLNYISPKGDTDGYAVRHHLTIQFFDDTGRYLGRAVRVSQRTTRYFAADGTYLGQRINQMMTTAPMIPSR
jgi:opacity protein-like surface antigen